MSALVPARRAREHIARLVAAGWSYREIASAGPADEITIAFIVNGRRKIDPDIAFFLCCIDPDRRPGDAKREAAAAVVRGRHPWRRTKAAEQQQVDPEPVPEIREPDPPPPVTPLLACAICGRPTRATHRRLCKSCYGIRQRRGVLDPLLSLAAAMPGDWVRAALCAQVDPDLWFPEKGGSTAGAKKVCERCPVTQECLQFALDNEQRFGIWGGRSERERRALARGSQLEESA